MTLIVTGDIIARWLFGSPTPWAMESATYLLVIATPLALAYTLKVGGHIRVPILVNRLPKIVQHWLRVITSILGLSYCAILTQLTWKQALISIKFQTTSGTAIDVTLWPFQMVIPIGLSIISLMLVLNIYNETRVAIHKLRETGEVKAEGVL
jgi:TRAP-type C4-dicarboxylate transport system permease small subunit